MASSIRLIKDRMANKKALFKKESIEKVLINLLKSKTLIDYLNIKRAIIEQICSNNTWEQTKDGFETRTDFKYDEKEKDISFTRHIITLKDGIVKSNGTPLAEQHLTTYQKQLETLIKIDEYFNKCYASNQAEVDKMLGSSTSSKKKNLSEEIYYENRHTNNYLNNYGSIGKDLLLKWLNKLSEQDLSIEELTEEFINDINNIKAYFEITKNQQYLRLEKNGISFEYTLLKVIKRYSPRGTKLSEEYTKRLEKRGLTK